MNSPLRTFLVVTILLVALALPLNCDSARTSSNNNQPEQVTSATKPPETITNSQILSSDTDPIEYSDEEHAPPTAVMAIVNGTKPHLDKDAYDPRQAFQYTDPPDIWLEIRSATVQNEPSNVSSSANQITKVTLPSQARSAISSYWRFLLSIGPGINNAEIVKQRNEAVRDLRGAVVDIPGGRREISDLEANEIMNFIQGSYMSLQVEVRDAMLQRRANGNPETGYGSSNSSNTRHLNNGVEFGSGNSSNTQRANSNSYDRSGTPSNSSLPYKPLDQLRY